MAEDDLIRMRDQAASAFEQTLTTLLGKPVRLSVVGESGPLVMEPNSNLRQQSFSIVPQPAAWVYAPEATWTALATAVLTSAGLDEVLREDQISTWSEVTQQSFGAFATSLTAEVRREVTAKGAVDISEPPAGISAWMPLNIAFDENEYPLQLAFSSDLVAVYDPEVFAEVLDKPQKSSRGGGMSKTLDLLLDVALPVSVSFGRTSLQLREVLKLNTGSIVELDRFVTEPVDVIVNDCVIARGDVVVVDGNYGVRIRQLASREDRLRTSIADISGVTSRKPE